MPMPPSPAPNQANDDANDGIERAPPVSAAIAFSETTAIHGPPNAIERIASEMHTTTHEAFDSMLALVPADTALSPTQSGLAAPCRTSP